MSFLTSIRGSRSPTRRKACVTSSRSDSNEYVSRRPPGGFDIQHRRGDAPRLRRRLGEQRLHDRHQDRRSSWRALERRAPRKDTGLPPLPAPTRTCCRPRRPSRWLRSRTSSAQARRSVSRMARLRAVTLSLAAVQRRRCRSTEVHSIAACCSSFPNGMHPSVACDASVERIQTSRSGARGAVDFLGRFAMSSLPATRSVPRVGVLCDIAAVNRRIFLG